MDVGKEETASRARCYMQAGDGLLAHKPSYTPEGPIPSLRRAGDVSSSTCTHAHDLYPSVILPVFARTTVGKILRNIICMTPTPGYSLGMTVEHSRRTVSTNNKLRKVYVECIVWRNNYSTLITFMTSSPKSKSLRSNPIHTLSHFTQQTVHTVLDTVRLETHSLIARPIDSASCSSETDVHSSEVQVQRRHICSSLGRWLVYRSGELCCC